MTDDIEVLHVTIPYRPKPKVRPRVTSKGTFMPKEYREWKDLVAEHLRISAKGSVFEGPVRLHLTFDTDEIDMTIISVDKTRPKHVRADIDNLIGGVMDALELSGVVVNDKQVIEVQAFTT